jgi:hypothetical protein
MSACEQTGRGPEIIRSLEMTHQRRRSPDDYFFSDKQGAAGIKRDCHAAACTLVTSYWSLSGKAGHSSDTRYCKVGRQPPYNRRCRQHRYSGLL